MLTNLLWDEMHRGTLRIYRPGQPCGWRYAFLRDILCKCGSGRPGVVTVAKQLASDGPNLINWNPM